jgi:hypothetical protein
VKKILAAGPWVGEFGWELFSFQCNVRAIAKEYDEVIVSSRKGNYILYKDFASDYIPFELTVVNSENGKTYLKDEIDCFSGYEFTDRYDPSNREKSTVWFDKSSKPEFIKFGRKNAKHKYDIVIHARNIPSKSNDQKILSKKVQRNWGEKNWKVLVEHFRGQGLKICSIGTKDAAFHIKGTVDKRGVSLKEVVNIMRSSTLIVGPSSGPMHLATLCDCPQYVWTHKDGIRRRYKKVWNPFGTRSDVLLVGDKMNPPPKRIIEGVTKTLDTL